MNEILLFDADGCLMPAAAGCPEKVEVSPDLALNLQLLLDRGYEIALVSGQTVEVLETVERALGIRARFLAPECGSYLVDRQTGETRLLVSEAEAAAVRSAREHLNDPIAVLNGRHDETRTLRYIFSFDWPTKDEWANARANMDGRLHQWLNGERELITASWDQAAGSFWARPKSACKGAVARHLRGMGYRIAGAAGDSFGSDGPMMREAMADDGCVFATHNAGSLDQRLGELASGYPRGYVANPARYHGHGLADLLQEALSQGHL